MYVVPPRRATKRQNMMPVGCCDGLPTTYILLTAHTMLLAVHIVCCRVASPFRLVSLHRPVVVSPKQLDGPWQVDSDENGLKRGDTQFMGPCRGEIGLQSTFPRRNGVRRSGRCLVVSTTCLESLRNPCRQYRRRYGRGKRKNGDQEWRTVRTPLFISFCFLFLLTAGHPLSVLPSSLARQVALLPAPLKHACAEHEPSRWELEPKSNVAAVAPSTRGGRVIRRRHGGAGTHVAGRARWLDWTVSSTRKDAAGAESQRSFAAPIAPFVHGACVVRTDGEGMDDLRRLFARLGR